MVGYGLLVLFALDMAQAIAAYRPFRPEDDQALALQVVERIAVPLVAYVLIFWWESPGASRFELRIRKLLSIFCVFFALACVAVSVMAVQSGIRLHAATVAVLERQDRERTGNLQRLAADLPGMPGPRVQGTYQELLRRGLGPLSATLPPIEEMRAQIAAAIPVAIEASHGTYQQALSQARRTQFLVSAKYCIGGVISALLFLLIWDATAAARAFAFFSRREDPTLSLTERFEHAMDALNIFPHPEEYHWYRRMRREWRLWREKRAARSSQSH